MMNDNDLLIGQVSIQFVQWKDSCGDSMGDTTNTITIKFEDAGGGPYMVIETERWAIEPGEKIEDLIFAAQAGRETVIAHSGAIEPFADTEDD